MIGIALLIASYRVHVKQGLDAVLRQRLQRLTGIAGLACIALGLLIALPSYSEAIAADGWAAAARAVQFGALQAQSAYPPGSALWMVSVQEHAIANAWEAVAAAESARCWIYVAVGIIL